MTRTPFFSVVIPTKGRARMAAQAARSVLLQTFPDFELIVADNDDSTATRDAFKALDDPRVRYVRTGGLSMADNWEAGCRLACGQYVCILEDKQLYKPRALERVYAFVEMDRPLCVRWQSDSFDPYGLFHRVRHARGNGGTRRMTARQALDVFLHGSYSAAKRVLPIGHLGCHHRELAASIRKSPLGRCCAPVEPDYTLAFAQLAFVDEILLIDEGLVIFGTTRVSNGLQFRLKSTSARRFVQSTGGSSLFFDLVPIKAMIIPNIIMNDFLRIREAVGGHLAECSPDWVNYFVENHVALQESRDLFVDVRPEEAEWRRALAAQPEEVRSEVARRIERQGAGSSEMRRLWKRLKRRTGLQGLERCGKSLLRAAILRDPDYRFRNVAEYLEYEASRDTQTADREPRASTPSEPSD